VPVRAATREFTWDALGNHSDAFLRRLWSVDLRGPPPALPPRHTDTEQCAEVPDSVGGMQMVQLNDFY